MQSPTYQRLLAQWRAYLSANRFTASDLPFSVWHSTEHAYATQSPSVETPITIPLLRIPSRDSSTSRAYCAPHRYQGLEVTRALGVLCSGDTLSFSVGHVPSCPAMRCVVRYTDGQPYLVGITMHAH